MTDADKIARAKTVLAQCADEVTSYLFGEQNLLAANTTLILIRETCQDALGEIMRNIGDDPADSG